MNHFSRSNLDPKLKSKLTMLITNEVGLLSSMALGKGIYYCYKISIHIYIYKKSINIMSGVQFPKM